MNDKPAQSTFNLLFDSSADEVNCRPHLKGEYSLPGETPQDLALWAGTDASGKLYARGRATPQNAHRCHSRQDGNRANIEAPPKIDLKVGEAVLFRTPMPPPKTGSPVFRLRRASRTAMSGCRLGAWPQHRRQRRTVPAEGRGNGRPPQRHRLNEGPQP